MKKYCVIGGGGGLSNKYIKNYLPTAPDVNYKFYDLLGSPENPFIGDVSLELLLNELEDFIISSEITNIIAHSFGCFLILTLLCNNKIKPTKIILLNPMPLSYSIWTKSIERLVEVIPKDVIIKAERYNKLGDGVNEFAEYFPYYTANKISCPIEVEYNAQVCNELNSQIQEYDYTEIVMKNLDIIKLVQCKEDCFLYNYIFDKNHFCIDNVGHFPFIEDINQFKGLFKKII